MASKKSILGFLCAAMTGVFVACGGNNNTTLQNPPAPPSSSPSIKFSPAPTGSITLVGNVSLIAVVTNDPTNAGVDWALLCQTGTTCGTLSPLHTASGKAATYTPPSSISGNSQSVTVEAFASADHNSNVLTKLTVTGFAGNLKGRYVFATQGEDANGVYELAGVMTLDGSGNITGGEQTHNDPLISVSDAITGGSYYIGPDGRGTLTINTADLNIGQAGIENLAMVVLSNSQALIGTFDNPNLQASVEVSTGTLQLQTSKAAPTGGYAFVVNGEDINFTSMAMGGVMNINSPNTISGAGSEADQDDGGTLTPSSPLTGTLTSPDAFGSLKFNLVAQSFAPSMQFTGYIVDSSHIQLIESDYAGNGVGYGLTAGTAVGQGAATGTFTSLSAFAGSYVFNIVGQDSSGIETSLAMDGLFTADGSGDIASGFTDEVQSVALLAPITDSFTGTYTIDMFGTGRVDTNTSLQFTVNGQGPEFIFYLTGNGNPPLMLDADNIGNSIGIGAIGLGSAYPQGTPPISFNGRYGTEYTLNPEGPTITTATGQATANGRSDTLTGVVDTNQDIQFTFAQAPDTPLTGTFSPVPTNGGRFTGTLNNTFLTPASANEITVAFYPVNTSLIFFIETDFATSLQSSFGYFSARTPVCPSCP